MDASEKLSPSFSLYEFLRSQTAERRPEIQQEQMNPPQAVIENLTYLANTTLQPIRDRLGYPLTITSGYRSLALNAAVGGSKTSQHVFGQAADVVLSNDFLTDDRSAALREMIHAEVREKTGQTLRADVNANFYLFAFICSRMDALDIDQVIHEYGDGYGRPAWIHISASTEKNKRQIVALGRYAQEKFPSLQTALAFGTAPDVVKEDGMVDIA